MVRYSIYNPYKSSPVDEPQRAEREREQIFMQTRRGQREREREREQISIADVYHPATLLSHKPRSMAEEDERSSKPVRTASEANVGVAMEAATPRGDKADPVTRMRPVSQGVCPFVELGDIAVL